MKKINPSIPKGTRDFGPDEMIKREYIFSILKNIFSKYGFQNIETPTIENLDVLKGNYGEEGDKLLYSILNSGDFLKNQKLLDSNTNYKDLKSNIANKGLRYDLTVPLARYVSMNRNNISFPFKRYQIQKVWRADKPQKGRYREFCQCDIDYVGTDSLLCEIEIINIMNSIFNQLGYNNYTLKLNNRKILAGISESLDIKNRFNELCISIDKIDKIGNIGFEKELSNQNFNKKTINYLIEIFQYEGTNLEKLDFIEKKIKKSKLGLEGIEDLREIINLLGENDKKLEIDFALARGLAYYTSSIFEIISTKTNTGSLAGGGRYDNLTEIFGLKDMSGIGISFGIERIYNLLEEQKLFPKKLTQPLRVLVTNLNNDVTKFSMKIADQLRENNISTEMYIKCSKLKKQLQFANNRKIPFVVIIGDEEKNMKKVIIKEMDSGNQKLVEINELLNILNLK